MERYQNSRSRIFLFSKGLAMGCADIVPGVSGGTVALITGIYDHLILAISSVKLKHIGDVFKLLFLFWKPEARRAALEDLRSIEWNFLLTLGGGIILAILGMSKVIPHIMDTYPFFTYSFFFGLIVFSLSIPYAHMDKGWRELVFGTLLAVITFFVVGNPDTVQGSLNPGYVFFSGALAICAMILPGISGSYILVILGQYKLILNALHEREPIILVFLAGIAVGIFSFIRLLKYILFHWHSYTMAALTGIMVGSLRKVWPGNYLTEEADLSSYIPLGVLLALVGAGLVYAFEKVAKVLHDPEPPI